MTRFPLVLAAGLWAVPGMAQVESREGIALQNQILELRQEVQQLEAGIPPAQARPEVAPAPAASAPNDVSADLVVRVSRLEEQVRTLQGQVDDLTQQVQRQNDQLSKQIGDLAFRIGGGAAAPASPGASPEGTPAAAGGAGGPAPASAPPPPHRTPEQALKEASLALARHDYPAAAAAAREAEAAHTPRAADARFVLAEAEAGQHQSKQAAADFYDVYNRNPKGPRAADALLGVAGSLVALNDPKDACEALAKLRSEYPQARSDIRVRAAGLRKQAGCH